MAYSPVDTLSSKVQIDYERARERKAAQKAASHKASLSRVAAGAAAATAVTDISSSRQSPATPSSKAPASRAWRRSSSLSPSISRRPSLRTPSRQVDVLDTDYADAVDGEYPELDSSSGADSASETDHEASFESNMPTLYDSFLAQPMRARDFAAIADHYVSRGSPSPPKHQVSLSSSNGQPLIARPFVERAYDGPGLGLRGDGHWYESAEEDGHACWTAYASNGPTSSVIVVGECRW